MRLDPALEAMLRGALALLLVAAAAHKLRDLGRFRAVVLDYRLLPTGLATAAAPALVLAEAGIGVALLAPPLRAHAWPAAAALLALYAGAIGINLLRGRRHIDCGCLGPAGRQPLSGWLVARNLVLVGFALTGGLPVAPRPLLWLDVLTVAGGISVLAALHLSLSQLLANAPELARFRGRA